MYPFQHVDPSGWHQRQHCYVSDLGDLVFLLLLADQVDHLILAHLSLLEVQQASEKRLLTSSNLYTLKLLW